MNSTKACLKLAIKTPRQGPKLLLLCFTTEFKQYWKIWKTKGPENPQDPQAFYAGKYFCILEYYMIIACLGNVESVTRNRIFHR